MIFYFRHLKAWFLSKEPGHIANFLGKIGQ